MLDMLWHRGYRRMLGVEPRLVDDIDTLRKWSARGVNIVPMEIQRMSKLIGINANMLIVIARPSHGGFVEDTLRLNKGNEVLYISRPENVNIDIPDDYQAVLMRTPKCPEEFTYRIEPYDTSR